MQRKEDLRAKSFNMIIDIYHMMQMVEIARWYKKYEALWADSLQKVKKAEGSL